MALAYEMEFPFCDPVTPLVRRTGRPTLVRALIDDSTRKSRYWNEYRVHYDTVDGLDLHVLDQGTEIGDLRFWRARRAPQFSERDRDLLRILEPGFAGFFGRRSLRAPVILRECFPSLTPRELEVASAAESGASDYLIGRRLGVSIWTIRTHLRHIFDKLDVQNRTSLAVMLNRPQNAEPGTRA
jgi:DNA-binding CsgD family transcriptional regulator